MKLKFDRTFWFEALVVLLAVNYMIVTVVLGDRAVFKYLRDLVLIYLVFRICARGEVYKPAGLPCVVLFFACLMVGFFRAPSVGTGVTVLRRYLFPLLMFFAAANLRLYRDFNRFSRFIVATFVILALWGVFQADLLGDGFLRRLGYPVEYNYGYKRDMLYNSFYFGGLGIQRVVATFSSSNICALATGTALIFLGVCYPCLRHIRHRNLALIALGLGYLLSFSRSNMLAMAVVALVLVWPYIPHRKALLCAAAFAAALVVVVGIYQGKSGIFYKLLNWVQTTLNFTESSAGGRSRIWKEAFQAVMKYPLGLGFGHVGALADQAGVTKLRFSSENSYLAIALDTGWAGLLLYLGFLFISIWRLREYARRFRGQGNLLGSRLCTAGYAIVVYMMVVMFFSNHIHDMEVVSYAYMYAGLAISYARGAESEAGDDAPDAEPPRLRSAGEA